MLTRKQHELLRFIHERLRETGIPPSFDEMKDALDLKSKSGIHRLITALEERGFIRRLPNRARALEVIRFPDTAASAGQRHFHAESRRRRARTVQGRRRGARRGGRPQPAIPVMGRIAAGTPISAIQDQSHSVTLSPDFLAGANIMRWRCVAIDRRGRHSRRGPRVIRKQDTANTGHIIVALIDDEEATLKRLRGRGSSIALEAANPAYTPCWVPTGSDPGPAGEPRPALLIFAGSAVAIACNAATVPISRPPGCLSDKAFAEQCPARRVEFGEISADEENSPNRPSPGKYRGRGTTSPTPGFHAREGTALPSDRKRAHSSSVAAGSSGGSTSSAGRIGLARPAAGVVGVGARNAGGAVFNGCDTAFLRVERMASASPSKRAAIAPLAFASARWRERRQTRRTRQTVLRPGSLKGEARQARRPVSTRAKGQRFQATAKGSFVERGRGFLRRIDVERRADRARAAGGRRRWRGSA